MKKTSLKEEKINAKICDSKCIEANFWYLIKWHRAQAPKSVRRFQVLLLITNQLDRLWEQSQEVHLQTKAGNRFLDEIF